MMGRTHALTGWCAGLAIAPLVGAGTVEQTMLFAVTTAGFALLPDLDHPHARASKLLGPFSRVLSWLLRKMSGALYQVTKGPRDEKRTGTHRHLSHTVLFAVGLGALASAGTDGRRSVRGRRGRGPRAAARRGRARRLAAARVRGRGRLVALPGRPEPDRAARPAVRLARHRGRGRLLHPLPRRRDHRVRLPVPVPDPHRGRDLVRAAAAEAAAHPHRQEGRATADLPGLHGRRGAAGPGAWQLGVDIIDRVFVPPAAATTP